MGGMKRLVEYKMYPSSKPRVRQGKPKVKKAKVDQKTLGSKPS